MWPNNPIYVAWQFIIYFPYISVLLWWTYWNQVVQFLFSDKFKIFAEFTFCWNGKSTTWKSFNIFQVVRTFARHFQTQECMPEDMLVRLCASKHLFAASEMQLQVFYSALDQRYHGSHPLQGSTTDVLAELQNQYYGIPYVPNTVCQ